VFYPNPERELGAIVTSLIQTGEFADPYILPMGSTAHLPPLYPYLLALIFRLLGFSWIAGHVNMLLVVLASSLLIALLPWLSSQFGLGR
jgi:4-amino-4-deoxy-L-arabinose transferase-like glycosyltransferase